MNTSPDKNFTIAVIATMSAGKSTLLNAMVGDNLLPAKNEACTSTIFRIEDHDELKDFRASYIDGKIQSDWQDVNRETLAGWNDRNYREIEIQGNLPYIKNVDSSYRVVFFDTPGPNNSTESNHEKITKRIIKRADFCYLICVLNASVMGVQDEWKLLSFVEKEIKKSSAKLCPLFVVNKIDLLDIEKGENPKILIDLRVPSSNNPNSKHNIAHIKAVSSLRCEFSRKSF